MQARPRRLLRQIAAGAQNERVTLASLLRKCIALGGQLDSADLRDWARRELDGYRDSDEELPPFRRVAAPMLVDGIQGNWQFKRKQLAVTELPDFARRSLERGLELTFGVAELERMAERADAVALQPSGMADLAHYMNASGDYGAAIHRVYFSVEPVVVAGVLDTIRTNLLSLVTEIGAPRGRSAHAPSAADVERAIQVVIKGRARASIAIGDGSSASLSIEEAAPPDRRFRWLRTPWAIVAGVVGTVSSIAGILTWFDWVPFS